MVDSFYYILISIVLISAVLAWIKSGTIINPTVIYNLWWGFFLFLSSLNLVGIRLPSMSTYYIFLLGMSMFSLGSITFLSSKRLEKNYYHKKREYKVSIKFKLFHIYQIIVFFLLVQLNFYTLKMLKNLDPSSFRGLVFSDQGVFGDKLIIFALFVKSAIYIGLFITIAGILLNKIPKKYIIIPMLNIILFSLGTMGRIPIFIAILSSSLGILYLFSITRIKIKPKHVIIFLLPIGFIIFMSFLRQTKYSSSLFMLIKNYFVWYFTGAFTAFDYFINNLDPGVDYDYSIMRGFFAGIEEVLAPLLRRILPSLHKINDSFHSFTGQFKNLGGAATHHSSHYTMYFAFYRDAGIYGVIIYSYIIGVINSLLFNKFRTTHSLTSFTVLLLSMYLSLMGIMRWEFRYIWSNVTLLGILFFTQKFVLIRKSKKLQLLDGTI
ncbi:MAG: O-antigen ligase [Candidatus Delongbacteria bacterium]|jgi:oligosaccharide repeat unit polymerase|nr:O-antigen ligase [Candidatus Delongbacteria bacterium]